MTITRFWNSCLLILILALAKPATAVAGESLFGFTFTTDTVPKNKVQVQQWYAGKFGKLNGSYANSLYRSQIEYGITDALQTAFYANVRHIYAKRNNRDQTTGGENVDEGLGERSFNDFLLDSVSLENLYRVTSPVTSPVGTAIYLESAFGSRRFEVNPKIILQTNYLDDQLVWAMNFNWGLGWNKKRGGEERWTRQTNLEYSTGLSYRFRSNWSAGVEFRTNTVFSSFSPSDIESTAFFLGPNLHYAARHFWITLAALLQIPPAIGYTENSRNAIEGGRIFGNTHEAVEIRLKMGYAFN